MKFSVLPLFFSTLFFYLLYFSIPGCKQAPETTLTIVSSDTFFNEYDRNPVAADAVYGNGDPNHKVAVIGAVSSISVGMFNEPFVSLITPSNYILSNIIATIDTNNNAAMNSVRKLAPGTRVLCLGKANGWSFNAAHIKDAHCFDLGSMSDDEISNHYRKRYTHLNWIPAIK